MNDCTIYSTVYGLEYSFALRLVCMFVEPEPQLRILCWIGGQFNLPSDFKDRDYKEKETNFVKNEYFKLYP